MTCYIFDLDGTLADISHRRHFVATKPKNWAAFNATMHLDKPNQPVVDLIQIVFYFGCEQGENDQPNKVVICSGRGEEQRKVTEDWLKEHAIPFHGLYMRPAKDNRADYIVKEELLAKIRADGYDPTVVFDDRNSVVEMWRRNGLICLQVAPGDF